MSKTLHRGIRLSSQPPSNPSSAPWIMRGPALGWWWLMLVGSLAGIASSISTLSERIALQPSSAAAFCDASQAGCSSVALAPHSAVFGPPNAAFGLALFSMFAAVSLSGITASRLAAGFLRAMLGLASAFLAFMTWYVFAVSFDLGALCLRCLVCIGALLGVSTGLVRVAAAEGALGRQPGRGVQAFVASGGDLVIAGGWAFGIASIVGAGLLL